MRIGGRHSNNAPAEPSWIEEVLHYWFEEVGERHWFKAGAEVDAQIRARFLALHEQISADQAAGGHTARAMLAAIIVMDQFSRNMFRGTARAYATDAVARRLANTAIERGFDLDMTTAQRQFVYLPFQHSEDRADQARSVALFEKLHDETLSQFALAHKSIIDRFGRFPHRNAILGRDSSPQEIAMLKEPMGSF